MLLYKYMPLSWSENLSDENKELFKKRCECIRDNLFWFSTVQKLNDPYDCIPHFTRIKSLDQIELLINEVKEPEELAYVLRMFPNCKTKVDLYNLFKKAYSCKPNDQSAGSFMTYVINNLVQNITKIKLSNIGILSLTEDHANCLMWAHYANNHRGICIEIEIPENTKSLKKVTYVKEQPSMMVYEAINEKYGKILGLLYKKAKHWEYEKEWRMVSPNGDAAKSIPGIKITKIISGLFATEETKNKIMEIAGNSVETLQIEMTNNYILKAKHITWR